MREIKFRGKRIDNNEWVEGCLLIENPPLQCLVSDSSEKDKFFIGKSGFADWNMPRPFTAAEVYKDSVGQFTGLKDKNGVDIYEGDLLREPAKSEWEERNYGCYEVFFHDGYANMDYNIGFSIARSHYHGSVCGGYIPSFKPNKVSKMEIIGNIYSNPELLK